MEKNMMDLIIFLCFVLFMLLAVCWIQAIQIEKQKEQIKYLRKSNNLYYNALQYENAKEVRRKMNNKNEVL
jgi:predicted Holliday junction resolvase-like endonuclease